MKLWKLVWLFGGLVLLGACSGMPVENHLVPEDAIAKPEDAGYLVGSIGYYTGSRNSAGPTSSNVYFRRVGSENWGDIAAERGLIESGDYELDDRTGNVFALPLQPGDYEFYNVRFYFYRYTGSITITAKEDFAVPFTIEKGKAHYIGEFVAYGLYGRNIFGLPVPAGGYFVHRDNFERDGPMLRAKYPALDGESIDPLDVKLTVPPFIVPLPE